jgi:sRNA-binding protein
MSPEFELIFSQLVDDAAGIVQSVSGIMPDRDMIKCVLTYLGIKFDGEIYRKLVEKEKLLEKITIGQLKDFVRTYSKSVNFKPSMNQLPPRLALDRTTENDLHLALKRKESSKRGKELKHSNTPKLSKKIKDKHRIKEANKENTQPTKEIVRVKKERKDKPDKSSRKRTKIRQEE